MFSPRESDDVLGELGDKFPLALVRATERARDDLRALRAWQPRWVATMFQREVAGIVHARIWDYVTSDLDGVDGISLRTSEPYREVRISTPLGRTFRVRVKRHSESDRISSYPTPSDLEFWAGAEPTFEGLEDIPLAAGYRWEAETGDVGAPVISYREGKHNVIWAVEVDGGVASGTTPIRYTPIPTPELPTIDLARGTREEERDAR